MRVSALRRGLPIASAVVAVLMAGAWLDASGPDPAPAAGVEISDEQAMRQAFEEATASCYANYQGDELSGCLMGVMQAHLETMESHNRQVGLRSRGRNDI
jgi:hypothetical protein